MAVKDRDREFTLEAASLGFGRNHHCYANYTAQARPTRTNSGSTTSRSLPPLNLRGATVSSLPSETMARDQLSARSDGMMTSRSEFISRALAGQTTRSISDRAQVQRLFAASLGFGSKHPYFGTYVSDTSNQSEGGDLTTASPMQTARNTSAGQLREKTGYYGSYPASAR